MSTTTSAINHRIQMNCALFLQTQLALRACWRPVEVATRPSHRHCSGMIFHEDEDELVASSHDDVCMRAHTCFTPHRYVLNPFCTSRCYATPVIVAMCTFASHSAQALAVQLANNTSRTDGVQLSVCQLKQRRKVMHFDVTARNA